MEKKILREKIKQSIPQIVMEYADCDVGILFPKNFKNIKKILVPLGLGEHTYRVKTAEKLMAFFDAEMAVFTVVEDRDSVPLAEKKQEEAIKLLAKAVNREIEVASPVENAIVKISRDYDLIILGPSTEWILRDVLFGSLPDKIIKRASCSVLIIKEPEQFAESWIEMVHEKIRKFFSNLFKFYKCYILLR